jgi:uncharacterized protein YyaL (SSP411 family)
MPPRRSAARSAPLGGAGLLLALLGCRSTGPAPETASRPTAEPMAEPHDDPTLPTNRLARETSPYLLQHQHNPVDWHPWGPAAFALARSLDRPVFLSVGYSACHWCHVMERESFEDRAVAELLNAHFVSIKVDREERPDVDELYMKAVTAMTGQGGWPMSVFLTPAGEPFFGGTYFPPEPRHGMPGFRQILLAISQRWKQDPAALIAQGQRLTDAIRAEAAVRLGGRLAEDVLERSREALRANFDPEWGGFGEAPKFPHSMDLRLCLRHLARRPDPGLERLLRLTLDRMASGGMYDQLAGGFHRYSTDQRWLIPHFEKMLYDNALLIPVYLEAARALSEPRYAALAAEIAAWVLAEMTTPEGGFASALDADVGESEGGYYAWTPEELDRVLGREGGRAAAELWDVSPHGNFEHGSSALWREQPDEQVAARLGWSLERLQAQIPLLRAKLLAARRERTPPARDDKIIAAWNGLMIGALARVHQQTGDGAALNAAQRAADFVLSRMRDGQGRLLTTWRLGRAQHLAGLQDHACLLQGLLELYESDFDPRWIREAEALAQQVEQRFRDSERGGYFDTPSDGETLLARLRTVLDGALPSGNAVLAGGLLRLSALSGRAEYATRTQGILDSLAELANKHPDAFSQLLLAEHERRAGLREVVLSGELADADTQALLAAVRQSPVNERVVVLADARSEGELVQGRRRAPGEPARAYVCRGGACQLPVESPGELLARLALH